MIVLEHVPNGYNEIVEYYGDMTRPEWEADNLKLFTFPFPMFLSWDRKKIVTMLRAHRLVGEAMVDALKEVLEQYTESVVMASKFNEFGGCFIKRNAVGSTLPSTHCWGIAIDYIPSLGPYNKPALTPKDVVEAFKKRGFVWGGDWKIKDGMHFQACRNY